VRGSRQTVGDRMDIVTEEQETLLFEVLTDIGQTTENSI